MCVGVRLSDVSCPASWLQWGDRVDVMSWGSLVTSMSPAVFCSGETVPGVRLMMATLVTWLLAVLLHREEPTATGHALALPCVTQLYLLPCVSLCFLSVLRCVPCPSAVTGGFAVPLSAQGVMGLASCGVADWTRFCRSRSFDTVGEESKFVCIPSALTVAENC